MSTITATRFFELEHDALTASLERRFFESLKQRNGTFRTTCYGRFDGLWRTLEPTLTQRAGSIQEVLDVGISFGITTIEMCEFFRKLGVEPTITGSDLYMSGYIVEPLRGVRLLTDRDGWVLQYDVAGRSFRPWTRRLDWLTLASLPRIGIRSVATRVARNHIRRGNCRQVSLVTPRLNNFKNISVIENDIAEFSPALVGRFDFIRVANVLNPHVFHRDERRRATDHLKRYMKGPGSLLLVARTSETSGHDGALLEKCSDGSMRILNTFGPEVPGDKELLDFFTG